MIDESHDEQEYEYVVETLCEEELEQIRYIADQLAENPAYRDDQLVIGITAYSLWVQMNQDNTLGSRMEH